MSERVLMIDDDASLAAMVAEYLAGRGLALSEEVPNVSLQSRSRLDWPA